MNDPAAAWTEDDSRTFIDLADVGVPGRCEQMDILLSLVPAKTDEQFAAVELASGEALLAERLLERFPRARLVAFDGSDTMIAAARQRLAHFGDRATVEKFDLASPYWLRRLDSALRCIVSSLAFHHLEDADKRRLYSELAALLEPGGALLIADVVAPATDLVRRSFAATWDAAARDQSLQLTGSEETFQTLKDGGWNANDLPEPEPGEMPAPLFEQLLWLRDARLGVVDCFWSRAGIAIFGGYR